MDLSEVVDGSNESLYYRDKELDPILEKGIPLLKTFQKVDAIAFKPSNRFPTPSLPRCTKLFFFLSE